jgi:hypothetical protein
VILYVALGLAFLGEVATEIAQEVMAEDDPTTGSKKLDSTGESIDTWTDGIQGGGLAVLGLFSTILAAFSGSDQVDAKESDEWTSVVELTNNSLVLDSEGEIDIGFSKATRIDVGNEGCDTYVKGQDVTIKAPGGILLDGREVQLC